MTWNNAKGNSIQAAWPSTSYLSHYYMLQQEYFREKYYVLFAFETTDKEYFWEISLDRYLSVFFLDFHVIVLILAKRWLEMPQNINSIKKATAVKLSSPSDFPNRTYLQNTVFIDYFEMHANISRNPCSKTFWIHFEIRKVLSVLLTKCHFIQASAIPLAIIYIQNLYLTYPCNYYLISANASINYSGVATFEISFVGEKNQHEHLPTSYKWKRNNRLAQAQL